MAVADPAGHDHQPAASQHYQAGGRSPQQVSNRLVARAVPALRQTGIPARNPLLALDNVYGKPAARGFLVLGLHVCTGVPHGLDNLVERDKMRPISAQRHP
jgi:hypothetical protein